MTKTLNTYSDTELLDFARRFIATPFEFTLGKRTDGAQARTFQFIPGEYPEGAAFKVSGYGTRYFNDKEGGSDTTVDQKVANVEALLTRWKAGDIGRKPGEPKDPVGNAARRILRGMLDESSVKKLKDMEPADAARALQSRLDAMADESPDTFATIMNEAKAQVREEAKRRERVAKLAAAKVNI